MVTFNCLILEAISAGRRDEHDHTVIGLSGQTEHNGAIMTALINKLE